MLNIWYLGQHSAHTFMVLIFFNKSCASAAFGIFAVSFGTECTFHTQALKTSKHEHVTLPTAWQQ